MDSEEEFIRKDIATSKMQSLWIIFLSLISTTFANVPIDESLYNAAPNKAAMYSHFTDNTVLVEYDMRYTVYQWRVVRRILTEEEKASKLFIEAFRLWEGGVIPYSISDGFTQKGRDIIREGMSEWEKFSCVRFRNVSKNVARIKFVPTGGCTSHVGKTDRYYDQKVTLGSKCLLRNIVLHLLGHTLGLFHEQSRPDRDFYINLHKENVGPRLETQFIKYDRRTFNTYYTPYDYHSIMHYGPRYFSKNGRPTITAKHPGNTKYMGTGGRLSFNDIRLVNMMYGCSAHCFWNRRCGHGEFLGKDCRCWCKGSSANQPVVHCCKDALKLTCGLLAKIGKCKSGDIKTRKKMLLMCPKACRVCPKPKT